MGLGKMMGWGEWGGVGAAVSRAMRWAVRLASLLTPSRFRAACW